MGNGQKKPDLMDVAIELKMTARQMERQSQKMEQQEKNERKKIVDVRSIYFISNFYPGFEQRKHGKCQDIRRDCHQKQKGGPQYEALRS